MRIKRNKNLVQYLANVNKTSITGLYVILKRQIVVKN